MGVIAESVPFKPNNIAALARKLDLSRDSVYQYLYQLREARLLSTLSAGGKGVSRLQKPDKIFLENPHYSFAFKEKPDIGNIRETFVLNQLQNAGLEVNTPGRGDFSVDGMVVEVGGKSKSHSQVSHLDDYLVLPTISKSEWVKESHFGFLVFCTDQCPGSNSARFSESQ